MTTAGISQSQTDKSMCGLGLLNQRSVNHRAHLEPMPLGLPVRNTGKPPISVGKPTRGDDLMAQRGGFQVDLEEKHRFLTARGARELGVL
jgi:hypothetical protein